MRFYLNIYHTNKAYTRYAIYYYYILHGYYVFGVYGKQSVGKSTFHLYDTVER